MHLADLHYTRYADAIASACARVLPVPHCPEGKKATMRPGSVQSGWCGNMSLHLQHFRVVLPVVSRHKRHGTAIRRQRLPSPDGLIE